MMTLYYPPIESLVCEHKFVFLRNVSFYNNVNNFGIKRFICIDIFFCEKCLKQKELKKEYVNNKDESLPDWAKTITLQIKL